MRVDLPSLSLVEYRPNDETETLKLCRRMLGSVGLVSGLVYVEDGTHQTRLCMDRGRIAWVHSEHCGQFLANRLRDRLSLSNDQFRQTLQECKARKANLGEHLVHCSLLSRDAFRNLLRLHCAEHLWSMIRATPAHEHHWSFEQRPAEYNRIFTFALEELPPPHQLQRVIAAPREPRAEGHSTTELLSLPENSPVSPPDLGLCLRSPMLGPTDQVHLVLVGGKTIGPTPLPPEVTALAVTIASQGLQQVITTSCDGVHVFTRLRNNTVVIASSTASSRTARLLMVLATIRGRLTAHFGLAESPQPNADERVHQRASVQASSRSGSARLTYR